MALARILVIDDEDSVRQVTCRVLERAGYQVFEAPNGREALTLLAECNAELVITDIFMPEQDGIATLRRMRKEFPGVKVIAVSGGDRSGMLNFLGDAELLGATRSLSKPYKAGELLRIVREVLGLAS